MIKGKLLYLRPIEPSDLGFLQELANDALVSGSVVGWDFPVSSLDQQRWFDNLPLNSRTRRLTVVDLQTHEPIGLTGLWDIDWHNQSALTATKLHPNKLQKGMGTDAILTTMAWTFYVVGLRRLYGSILDFNGPSLGAYVKRCGWRIEGRELESILRKGRWCDLYQVAALKKDFDELDISKDYVELVCPTSVDDIVAPDTSWWRKYPNY